MKTIIRMLLVGVAGLLFFGTEPNADHEVGFIPGSHEGRVNCYWTNSLFSQTGIIGHFPSEAAALDTTDPNSCASWLLDNQPWQIFFSQYHYRELVILSHDSTASLNWTAPTTNDDGTPLTDLAGYNLYGGIGCDDLTKATSGLTVLEPATTYTTNELTPGEWCFALTAVDLTGNESILSNTAEKTIGGGGPPPAQGQITLSWTTPVYSDIIRTIVHAEPSRLQLWVDEGGDSSGQAVNIVLDEPDEPCMFVRVQRSVPPDDTDTLCWDDGTRNLAFTFD